MKRSLKKITGVFFWGGAIVESVAAINAHRTIVCTLVGGTSAGAMAGRFWGQLSLP